MAVLKPWTPVEVKKENGNYEISVWNRRYTLDGQSVMFSSVESGGTELLSSPIRFVAKINGKEQVFCKAENRLMMGSTDESCTVISTFQSDLLVINASHTVEFDGCDNITLSFMPTGKSPAATFGLEEFDVDAFNVESIIMEVPVKKALVQNYHVYPYWNKMYSNKDDKPLGEFENMCYAGIIPDGGIHTAFMNQLYLGGENCGIGFFFPSNECFANYDSKRVFEVNETEDSYVIKINFFDKTPPKWKKENRDESLPSCNSRMVRPISINFGMQVTPVKPFPENPYKERNLHIDCFKKVLVDYEEFLSKPVVEGSDEIGFDRIKRLGVNTLYLHEKWNDIQNSPEITEESAERLRYIVSECHKRGIKVIPYFGFEISTLSPLWTKYGEKHIAIPRDSVAHLQWYRYPYQRDMNFCPESGIAEYFAEGLIALQKEFGFDGFYFDGTSQARPCVNESHGCGFRDENRKLQPTYAVWGSREILKSIYEYTSENGLIVNLHVDGSPCLHSLGFGDSTWEGEGYQGRFLHGELKEMPESLIRSQFTGRDRGLPVMSICYSNPPTWTFESAAAMALVHGSLPKPVDIGEPLEYMSKIWDAVDSFDIKNAKWKPYYGGNDVVTSDDEGVKISVYETDNEILAFCTSTRVDFDKEVTISATYPVCKNAISNEILSENGKFSAKMKGIECLILKCEK